MLTTVRNEVATGGPAVTETPPAAPATITAETFGGPDAYTTEHGGYPHMVRRHRGLGLTQEQRLRRISRMVATADLVGLPDDPDFRAAFSACLEWGTRIAVYNAQPGADVIEHAPVPRWGWGEAPPFVPFPWDDPEAADRGRAQAAAVDDPREDWLEREDAQR